MSRPGCLGAGPTPPRRGARTRRNGTDNVVRFLGYREDVRPVLRAADAFVLPSRYEGMPLALLEAMAAGLPCVVSDVGDCGLLVREGARGVGVPTENRAALADALGSVLAQPHRRRG